MFPKLTLMALGLARLASAERTCGAPDPSPAQIQNAKQMAIHEAERGAGFRAETITVNTYFHIVASSEQESDGYLSEQAVADQFKVLNDDFAPSGFQFNLLNTTRTVNAEWATGVSAESPVEAEMKSALRQGSYSDLNVYFLTAMGGVLGYCYFPVASPSDEDLNLDGCAILAATAPGGSETNFNLGKTVVHEVGHWMGLFHTFQGGCGDQDQVADTPAQSGPSSGCPTGRDSCPAEGVDPIHNYMDYSDDACYEEFTEGQSARMLSSWEEYRI